MKLDFQSGTYVVAVSGGVDSVVLLDLLFRWKITKEKPAYLIVAHFDHGIRAESETDRLFVECLAKTYELPFVYASGNLGAGASEEAARVVRYNFLNKVVKDYKARGLFTAHHQDDLIETAMLNTLRGTGRRGLNSLKSSDILLRPLLSTTKADIIKYAIANNLKWHEDSTNNDLKYTRNYIRHRVLPKLASDKRQQLLKHIDKQGQLNDQIDSQVAKLLTKHLVDNRLPRLWFNSLDSRLSREVIIGWMRLNSIFNYDRRTIERLGSSLKVAKPGSLIDIIQGWQVKVSKTYLALEPVER